MAFVFPLFLPKTPLALPTAIAAALLELPTPAREVPAAAHRVHWTRPDRMETHIRELHMQLRITMSQQDHWQKIAQVMRGNAGTMASLHQQRSTAARDMTAPGDLNACRTIAEVHAEGIRKLASVFQALYDSMSKVQKQNADMVFLSRQIRPASRQG
ncbi:Spy/CpxP family protein refolding chaperone [Cupriavidus sp. 2TAF22]|uniref:Spy/CpxP family protein refolding chaperone n=1 Tax=unclassified Cupriavidus TaxID=2640874 RepID=UPI003F91408B